MPKLQQQGIVHIGLILLLLAGLIAGVYLVQHPQIFKPKAAGGKVWLIDESGNSLPQKDGGVYEVPSQQIRIYINQPTVWSPPGSSSRPQSRLPNLVTAAYAQTSQCNGTVYSCSDIKCDDSSFAPGTGCYEKDDQGKLTDPNNRYRTECRRNCPTATVGQTTTQQPAGQTGQLVQPQADTTTPTISGASWDQEGNYLTITGANFGNSGSVYYSKGGSEQVKSESVSSWSPSSIKIGAEIPLGAAKTSDNMISGGNYLKVCRTDSKCSSFWSPIPDRPKFRVNVPIAPNAGSQGQGAPAAPTQPEVIEVTQEIRISSVIDYVKKDGVCEGSEDPAKHCMRLTENNPDARYTFAALLTQKGYVSWWLANTTEDQNVYVGFISNKGQDFFHWIRVRIVRPQSTPVAASPAGGAGGAGVSPAPSARSASPSPVPAKNILETLTGSPNVACIEGEAYLANRLDESSVKTEYGCRCSQGTIRIFNQKSGEDLVYTASPCELPPSPSPSPAAKPSCQEVGVCVRNTGDERGFYSKDNYLCSGGTDESKKYFCPPEFPTCLAGTTCKAPCPTFTGVCVNAEKKSVENVTFVGFNESGKYFCSDPAYSICLTGVTPSPSPSLSPQPPGQPTAGVISVQNNTDSPVTVNKVEIIWPRFDLIPVLFPYSKSISGIFTLAPKNSQSFGIPPDVCSDADVAAQNRKVIRVEYTDLNEIILGTITGTPTKEGEYQCGGSGLVSIP